MKQGSVAVFILAVLVARTVQQTTETAESVYKRLTEGGFKPPSVSSDALKLQLSKFPAISVLNGILYFASWPHVETAYKYLDAKQAEYNYQNYVASQTATLTRPPPFNPAQAYEEFETQYLFSSLRKKVNAEFQAWSNTEPIDPSKNPEANVVPEDGYRTLLNIYSEVNVGKVFYRVTAQGTTNFASYFDMVAMRSQRVARLLPPTSQCFSTNEVAYQFTSSPSPSTSLSRIYVILHYINGPPPRVIARVRLQCRANSGSTLWLPCNGPVYACAWGYVSSLYWDPGTTTVYPNLCLGQFGYNLLRDGCASGSGWSTVTHQVTLNFRTKATWTNGDFFGLNPQTGDFHKVWPLNL